MGLSQYIITVGLQFDLRMKQVYLKEFHLFSIVEYDQNILFIWQILVSINIQIFSIETYISSLEKSLRLRQVMWYSILTIIISW
jgi:hypothetical protein